MSVYGVCNKATDSKETLAVLQGKKIDLGNICPTQNIQKLLERLKAGDTVWVVSIKTFGSVGTYTEFAMKLANHGVNLRSMSEPYLDITNGRGWKRQTVALLKSFIHLEEVGVRSLMFPNMNPKAQRAVLSVMQWHDISLLAEIFSSEGIQHR